MGLFEELAVSIRPPADGDGVPTVVLVHGSLDRGASFGRAARRLPDLRVVTYDRRGYHRSRSEAPPPDLHGHADDLLCLLAVISGETGPAVAVGHSFGGDVVIAAALASPDSFASIGAYEPPMPWLGLRRDPPRTPVPDRWTDPAQEVERFFRRMVGDASWERMPEAGRAERLADGPALVADLRQLHGPAPFDVTRLSVPAVFGRGGSASSPHHRATVAWLADHVGGSRLFEIEGAGHGAHLSHPDAFAAMVLETVRLGRMAGGDLKAAALAGPSTPPAPSTSPAPAAPAGDPSPPGRGRR